MSDAPGTFRQRKKLLALLSAVQTNVQAAADAKPRKKRRLVNAAATKLTAIQRLARKPSVPAMVRAEVDAAVGRLIADVRRL